MSITTFFMLLGGLGLFLFGMKLMSEGLEKAAGAKMRGILEFFTKNRFIGMLVGILFTAVVQSSSATTVMVCLLYTSGRGAYICPAKECLEKARKSKGLERSFKQSCLLYTSV